MMNKQGWTSHAQLHKPVGATRSQRDPHLFMDAGKHMELFGKTFTSVEVFWMQKGLNEMKNQCHEPSCTLLIHPPSSSIHIVGGDLLNNHSAVSVNLKNVK